MQLKLSQFRFRVLLIFTIIGICVFCISLVLSSYYIGGDQRIYNKVYDEIAGLSFSEAILMYKFNINSEEPIHFLLVWVFSNLGVSKSILMGLFNCVLVFYLIKIFVRLKVNPYIIGLIILTNFYIYVLFFAAERLKFGFIFFLIFFDLGNSYIKKYSFLIVSFLAHFQLIFFPIIYLFANLRKLSINLKKIVLIIFLSPLFFYFLFMFQEHILGKFESYSLMANSKNLILNVWQPIFFMILTFFYSKNRIQVFLSFLVIILFSALLGPERITMIAFIYFMYFSLRVNNGVNVGVIFSAIYYGLKTVFFIYNILYFNNGFAE